MKEYEDNVPTHRLHQKGVGNCCSAFQSVDRSNSICIEISDTILETSPGADAHNYINYTGADICLGCHPQADEDFVTSIPNMWMVTATSSQERRFDRDQCIAWLLTAVRVWYA